MADSQTSFLAAFHRFVGTQLLLDEGVPITPEEALSRWRAHQKTLGAIREGLADVEAGRTVSLDGFDREFRQRHGIEGTA